MLMEIRRGSVGMGKDELERGMMELSGVMVVFCIVINIVVIELLHL